MKAPRRQPEEPECLGLPESLGQQASALLELLLQPGALEFLECHLAARALELPVAPATSRHAGSPGT